MGKVSSYTTASAIADADLIYLAQDDSGDFLDRNLTGQFLKRLLGAAGNVTTTDPGVGDDDADGYRAGSIWLNTTDGGSFICTDATTGAAVWSEFAATGGSVTASSTTSFTNKTLNSFTNTIDADNIHIEVRNDSGGILTAGTPVYVTGYNVGQDLVTVDAADASSPSTMSAIGIVETDIADNTDGSIIAFGKLGGLNTGSFGVGDLLYVSATAGALTATNPGNGTVVQPIAVVLRSNASTGIIDVRAVASVPNPAQSFIIACSDETTALTTGAAKATFRMPYAFTLTEVRAGVTTAPTGAAISIGINEGGSTILSTDLTIDATEKTSTTAATAAVISDTALADDAEITIDLDQVGSTIAGAGLEGDANRSQGMSALIINPYTFAPSGGGGGTATFVQGGDVAPVNTTGASVTYPGDLVDGNLLVLFVAARSAITTPSGYALVTTSPSGGNGGRVGVYTKTIASDASATLNVSWAASGRGSLAWAEVSGSGGTPVAEDSGTAGPDTTAPLDIAVATATGADQVAVAAAWNEVASGTETISVSAGWTLFTTATRADNRFGAAQQAISSASTSGSFSRSTAGTSGVAATVVLASP